MKVNFGGDSYILTAGWHSLDSWHSTVHTGVDIGMKCGTPVKAPVEGVIEKVVDYGHTNIGKGVIMQTNDGEHLIFGHLSENGAVHIGQHVTQGQVIGISGTTGRSSGCHLHLGARNDTGQFVDPSKYLDGGTATQHIASVPKTPSVTSQHIIDSFGQQMHSFFDQMGQLTLQFIDFSLQLSIHKGLLALDLILSWI